MKKDKKQQQQVVALTAVVVIIVGLIGYFYWSKLLPVPVADGTNIPSAGSPRLQLVSGGDYQALLNRQDFLSLQALANVPVKVPQNPGNPRPFASDAEATGKTAR